MSQYRWIGLESIKIGVSSITTATSLMPSTFTTIQNLVQDSAHLAIELPEEIRLYGEDSDIPDIITIGSGATFIEFATRDMDLNDTFVLGLGGSTDGTVYSFPVTAQAVRERSVRAVTEAVSGSKFMVEIPKASVCAYADLQFRKLSTENGTVGFICRILQGRTPGGAAVPPMKITRL